MKVNFLALQSRNPLKLIVPRLFPSSFRPVACAIVAWARLPAPSFSYFFHVQYAALPASYFPEISFLRILSYVLVVGPATSYLHLN